jgi:hypothetical protein
MQRFTKKDFLTAVFLAVLVLFTIVMMVGCGEPRPLEPVPAPEPGVGDQLRELGSLFLFWGGIALGLGIIARIALSVAVPAALTALIPGIVPGIASLVAQGGAASVACGAAFTWLADYLWLVVLACIATGLAWAYLHRAKLRSWMVKWQSQTKKH